MQPLWKIVWRFLKKLKIELSYNLAIPPGNIFRKNENTNLKRYMQPSFYSSIVCSSQDMEAICVYLSVIDP